MNTTTITRALKLSKITGVILSLGALVVYPHIPNKTIQLYPNDSHRWVVFSDVIMGGDSLAKPASEPGNTVHCRIGSKSTTTLCGNNLMFFQTPQEAQSPTALNSQSHAVAPKKTLDLSGYKGIEISLKYAGDHQRLRFTLTNYEPNTQPVNEKNSDRIHRFMHSYAYVDELTAPIYLDFNEFKVADWWIDSFKLHRRQTVVKLDNIRGLYVELVNAKPQSEHTLTVVSATVIGDWISKEQLYLTIILLWLALLLTEGAWRAFVFYNQQQACLQSLNTLKHFYKTLQAEEHLDPTTLVLNQNAVQSIISAAFSKGAAANIAVLIMEMDTPSIDHLPTNNTPDEKALKHIATLLKQNTRKHDNLGRWGDHRFIIITEQPSAKNALQFATKLSNIIKQHQPAALLADDGTNQYPSSVGPTQSAPITLSIGLSLTQKQDTFDATLERAEQALQQAKTQGPSSCRGL